MKILICHNRYKVRGGEDVVVDQEIELLKKNGVDVFEHIIDNDQIHGVKTVSTAFNTPYSFPSKRAIQSKIREVKPDIVHVHNFFPRLSPSIFFAAKRENVPTILTVHNYRLICANGLFLRDGAPCELCLHGSSIHGLRYQCYRNSIFATAPVTAMIATHRMLGTWKNQIDRFIVPTQFGRKKFQEFGIPQSKLAVRPNFVEDFAGSVSRGGEKPYALYLGRLSSEKGVLTLLKAWTGLDFKLKIAGRGELETAVREKQGKNIEYLGALPRGEAIKILAGASLLVFPSECYEGAFPLSLIEALSAGTPIAASNLGTIPEFLTNGVSASLFNPSDPTDLRNAVKSLLSDDTRRTTFRNAGRAIYEKNFTPEIAFARQKAIYENLL